MKSIRKQVEYPQTTRMTYDESVDSVLLSTGARPANEEELIKDQEGYTNPNLHRRIDPQEIDTTKTGEVDEREYILEIHAGNSYRTTIQHFRDDSVESDVVRYREIKHSDGSVSRLPIELP